MAAQHLRKDSKEIGRRFGNESIRVQQLVAGRPKHWEYLLAIELLRSKLVPICKKFDDLRKDQAFKRSSQVGEREVVQWLTCKLQDLSNLIPHLQGMICDDLIPSVSEAGKHGNPTAILEAVEKICEGGRQLLAWEEEMRFTLLPARIQPIQRTLRGATTQCFGELNGLADKLNAPFSRKDPAGKYKLKIVFKDPPNMPKLNRQLSNLQKDMEMDPWNWVGWS